MRVALATTLVLLASPLMAEQEIAPASEEETQVEDYTPDALRLVLRDVPEEDEQTGFADQGFPVFTTEDWTVRFMPLMAPFRFNEGLSGPVANQIVDPFSLLGVDMAPAGAAGDEFAPADLSWRERWFRWRTIRFVNAENRRQNELAN